MTFVEAFRTALGGALVRRKWWNGSAYLTVCMETFCLKRVPEMRNWSGLYCPTLDDVEAQDWEERTESALEVPYDARS